MSSITEQASKIGTEHGQAAASWVFDGNTTDQTYRDVLAGIESGDPEVMDAYRVPDLSGEWADGYTPADLADELVIERDAEELTEAAEAWELAVYDTFWATVETTARDYLVSLRVSRLTGAGLTVSYVDRRDAENGYIAPYGYIRQNRPGGGLDAFVDLGSIATGDDSYGQVNTVQRSNFRRLQADYPDAWTTISYINADALGAFVADLDDDATDILVSLATDYPVYDDEDLSEIESDEISEQWDDFGSSDFRDELPDDVLDAWDGLDDEAKRVMFWDACEASGYYPEHSGVEVLWRYAFEKTLPIVADRLR